jgi:transcriptional regulator with XRE-family HTH domain
MARKHLSQRDLAGILDWSQSRISKNLNARIELGLDDLGAMCFGVGISLTEAVRDHGLEFCAEMTPTELRILERIRQLTKPELDAWMQVLRVQSNTRPEDQRAAPNVRNPTKKRV